MQLENIVTPDLDALFWSKLRTRTLDKLGYTSIPAGLRNALDESLETLETQVRPAMMYHILPVIAVDKHVKTEAGSIRSSMFSRLAHMCTGERWIVFMISTLGEGFDRICKGLSMLNRQFVFDVAGSQYTEMAADMLHDHVQSMVERQGKQCGMPFSPGYCDWELAGQQVIFNALDAGSMGVRLTEHYVMLPSKTISAVALIADELPAKAPCHFCARNDCLWRRLPCKEEAIPS